MLKLAGVFTYSHPHKFTQQKKSHSGYGMAFHII